MLSRIIDECTRELSEAINIIWSEPTLKANLERIKKNPPLGGIKRHLDNVQSILLELLSCVEEHERQLALGFYWIEPSFSLLRRNER